jgi:hypothetical protein
VPVPSLHPQGRLFLFALEVCEMSDLTAQATQTETIWQPKNGTTPKAAAQAVCAVLDTATTSMGRATHYNTRDEQQVAEFCAHEDLLKLSRDLYTVLLALPGATDRAMQVGAAEPALDPGSWPGRSSRRAPAGTSPTSPSAPQACDPFLPGRSISVGRPGRIF